MGLRPGRTIRKVERPYTRVSRTKPRKSYVVGVPFPKLHQFEMGTRTGDFDTTLYLVAKKRMQMRDNSLEAARIVAVNFLEKKMGVEGFFLKILVYPHHVLREKPIATGAGADRYSRGMALSFGKPVGTAVQIKEKQRIIRLKVSKANLEKAKLALEKFGKKISVPTWIVVEE